MAQFYSAAALGSQSTAPIVQIDPFHPYFLYSSDHPGMLLVNQTLIDHNYNQWKRSMVIALSVKLKIGMVDGTLPSPAATSAYLPHWIRSNITW